LRADTLDAVLLTEAEQLQELIERRGHSLDRFAWFACTSSASTGGLCQRHARLNGRGALFQLGIIEGLSCHNLGLLTEISAKFVVTFGKNRAILNST
jgi:hypothetical protein